MHVHALLWSDYSHIQAELSLCQPPSSAQDVHQLYGLLRNAFTLMAMLDYPYSTHFMGSLPANPVKVKTQGGGGARGLRRFNQPAAKRSRMAAARLQGQACVLCSSRGLHLIRTGG